MIIVANCHAGSGAKGEDARSRLEGALRETGVPAEIWCADGGDSLRRLAERAAHSSAETIVAAGGDGTINSVAGVVVASGKKLGVLPLGTLNHFAKDAGIPQELNEAVKLLVAGHEREVDVAEVNGRIFLNNSSIGVYPQLVRDREEQQRKLRRGKWPAMFLAVLSNFHRLPRVRLHITPDQGTADSTRTPFFFVGNNEYHTEGLRLGGRDCLDCGTLNAYFVREAGPWHLVGLALRSLFGRVKQAPSFETLAARELVVQTRHPSIDVALDGEVCHLATPLRYRIRPRALRIIGPAPAA